MRGWGPYTTPINTGTHKLHFTERNLNHIHLRAGPGLLGKGFLRASAICHTGPFSTAAAAKDPARAAAADDGHRENDCL